MTKIRVFYDKAGNILAVENRPDDDYLNENVIKKEKPGKKGKTPFDGIPPENDDEVADLDKAKWIVMDSDGIGEDAWEDFEVKGKQLVKKKKARSFT